MNKPSLIAAAVAAVLTTIGQGATAAPWTQARLDKVIGEQASGEEPVLQDIALKLDQSQIQSGASAAAGVVDGTRSASASRNSLTLALSEDFSLAELAAAEVSALGEDQTAQTSAQASDNMLNVQAQNVTASGRWTGASVESSSNALAQGNGLNVTAETLDVSSRGESTGFYGSVVDGSTGTASGSWVTMSVGTAEAWEMQVAGAQVTGVSAEALNNKVTVGFDEYAVEELRLYGGRATAQPTSDTKQAATQAIASNNEVTGVFGTVHGDSDITVSAGKAEATGQDAVSVADGNSTTIEIAVSSFGPILDIQGGVSSAGSEMGDPLSLSAQASASGNIVTGRLGSISDSDIAMVAGSARANAQNAVSVADGNRLAFDVSTLVSNPVFLVTGGESVAGTTYGSLLPLSAQASASGNKVSGRFESVSDSTISMFAGSAAANGQNVVALADGNQLDLEISSLSSSDDSGDVFSVIGGNSIADSLSVASPSVSAQASASDNEVSARFESVSNSDLSMVAGRAEAYGQKAVSSADGNRLTFEVATSVSNSMLEFQGGLAMAGGASGDSQSAQASASGNLVTGVITGSFDQSSSLGINGGRAVAVAEDSTAVADNNRVQLSLEGVAADGSISLLLSGAVAQAQTRAAAGGNLVVVSGKDKVVSGTLYGAQVSTLQWSGEADASDNRVEVSGIDLTGSITGAQVRNENRDENSSGSVNAEGNVVVISNSTIEGNLTGANLLGSHINASGNTVILGEGTVVNGNVTAVVGANAELARSSGGEFSSTYGDNRVVMNNATVSGTVCAVSSDSGSLPVDVQTAGNTLVLAGHNEAGSIEGFESLDLTLSEQNKDQSVLTLTGGQSTLSDATIVIRGAEVLDQGKLIEAIDGAGLSVTDATVELRGTFIKKVAQNVYFTVESGEDNALTTDSDVLASAKVQATESASSLSESLLGTAAFVRQGAEFVADDGLATMEFAARSKQGLNAFAVMQGSSMHYDALSGVDVSGFTLLAGAAVQQGNLTFASFVESGWGNSEGDIAKNSTDLSYFGVGLAARYRFESGFYGEGAVRLGRASSDFAASFVEDGDLARYESDVFYATMHMAAGYKLPLNDFVTADMYARYTFSFLDNDSVDLNDAAQSRAELDSVVAHALRIGARVKGGFTDAVNWKAGIAYEHMFDGAAGGTVDGVSITEAEMDGGSVIGELGVSVKPGSETSPWTLQFALKGYLGEREGVSGNGMLVYSF